jgi:hypothetical protein
MVEISETDDRQDRNDYIFLGCLQKVTSPGQLEASLRSRSKTPNCVTPLHDRSSTLFRNQETTKKIPSAGIPNKWKNPL